MLIPAQYYGIWGGANGEYDGVLGTLVGEASMAMKDLCFHKQNLSSDKGHSSFEVMYIAFVGAVLFLRRREQSGTESTTALEISIKTLGNKLVSSLKCCKEGKDHNVARDAGRGG